MSVYVPEVNSNILLDKMSSNSFFYKVLINSSYLKFNSNNGIGNKGAVKLLESFSKLSNLNNLNLNFSYKFKL